MLYQKGESSISISKRLTIPIRTVIEHLHYNKVRVRTQREALQLSVQRKRLNPRVKQILKQKNKITLAKSYILGVLCGDGWIYYNTESPKQTYQIGLAAIDKDFVVEFSRCLSKVFGSKPKVKKIKSRNDRWKDQYRTRFCSRLACDTFLEHGTFKTMSWIVPQYVLCANKGLKASFLRGFFDSEGHVDIKTRRVSAVSANKKGLIKVMVLLDSLKIRSMLQKHSSKETYSIYIQDRCSVVSFFENVGFTIRRKAQALDILVKNYKFTKTLAQDIQSKLPRMLKLRKKGLTYDRIAELLGLSSGTVWKYINKLKDPERLTL